MVHASVVRDLDLSFSLRVFPMAAYIKRPYFAWTSVTSVCYFQLQFQLTVTIRVVIHVLIYFGVYVCAVVPVSHGPRALRYEMTEKKLSYCWETVRRESMPRIAEMDVEMTT